MAYICTKINDCKKCKHFRYDEDNERMACFAEADSKEAIEKFLKTIDDEIKKFRENYASFLFPEAVYKDYYKIFFIESYFNMLFSTADKISEDVICWLNKQKNPLEFLYGKWLSCDGVFSESWDDMSDWVNQLFYEEKAENI